MDVQSSHTSNDPEPRHASQAAVVDGKLFLYRGYLQSYQGKNGVSFPAHFEVFDGKALQWRDVATRGRSPRAYQGIAITSIGSKLYLYGGYDATTYSDELFEIDTLFMAWNELIPQNPYDGPMRKAWCGLVSLSGDVLCAFGGRGIPRDGPLLDGSRFIPVTDSVSTDGHGFTNELRCYHVQTGTCIHRPHTVFHTRRVDNCFFHL